MAFINVTETLQKSIAQLMGSDYMEKVGELSTNDTYKLVDIGKDVQDIEGGVDKFVKALAVQIGKIVLDTKRYKGEVVQLFRDLMDWGGITEVVKFELADILDDDSYSLVDGTNYGVKEHTFYQPKVRAKLYEEMKAILIPLSKSEDAVMMAFRDWSEMEKFMGSIGSIIENTIEVAMQAISHSMLQCGIAISDSATETAIHLLTEYKALNTSFTKTGMNALRDVEYQKYILERIASLKDNMRMYGSSFNNGSFNTFSNKQDINQAYLSNFVNAIQYNLNIGIYKDAGIEGDYDKISSWQGSVVTLEDDEVSKFTYDNNSSVLISADSSNKLGIGTSAYEGSDCIGLIYDKKSLWLNIFKQRVNSSYTANASFWTTFTHILFNLCIDSDYNMVALFND